MTRETNKFFDCGKKQGYAKHLKYHQKPCKACITAHSKALIQQAETAEKETQSVALALVVWEEYVQYVETKKIRWRNLNE